MTTTEIIQELKRIAVEEYGVSTVGFYDEIRDNNGVEIQVGAFEYWEGKWNIAVINSISDDDKIITLAHELGHVHDLMINWKMNTELWEATQKPAQVLPKEQDAWLISVDFLQRVGYQDWDYFMKWVHRGMDSYYQLAGVPTRKNLFADDFYPQIKAKIAEIKGKAV